VLLAYLAVILGRTALEAVRDPAAAPVMMAALPTMHASWGAGFVRGLLGPGASPRAAVPPTDDLA
jgi:hypothetical protein